MKYKVYSVVACMFLIAYAERIYLWESPKQGPIFLHCVSR